MSELIDDGGLAPEVPYGLVVEVAKRTRARDGKGFAACGATEGGDLVRTDFRREGAASAAPNEP